MRRLLFATALAALIAGAAIWYVVGGRPASPPVPLPVAASETIEELRPAAERGDRRAQYRLGLLFHHGEGRVRDMKKAWQWYTAAAEAGYADAQYALGRLLEGRDGIRQDYGKAAAWYRLAISLGDHRDSAFALGQLYFNGRGVPNDYEEALKFFRIAAQQDHPAAEYILGAMYEAGWGVENDLAEAYKWFSLALPHRAEAMAIDAKYDPESARNQLLPKMNRNHIDDGKRRIAEWRKRHPAGR